ncbi:hypothetical protein PENSPDRAFT_14122 [Peniophora sp. CONT]|nr:hypothetical protein PENSPDRAFT_14122 [Peniophora sp. CONT]
MRPSNAHRSSPALHHQMAERRPSFNVQSSNTSDSDFYNAELTTMRSSIILRECVFAAYTDQDRESAWRVATTHRNTRGATSCPASHPPPCTCPDRSGLRALLLRVSTHRHRRSPAQHRASLYTPSRPRSPRIPREAYAIHSESEYTHARHPDVAASPGERSAIETRAGGAQGGVVSSTLCT